MKIVPALFLLSSASLASLASLVPGPAKAQTTATTSPWTWTVGGEARARYENRNNRDFSSAVDDKRQDYLLRLRLNVTVRNARAGLLAFFQPQYTADRVNVPGRHITGDHLGAHQLYLDYRPVASAPAAGTWLLRAGRQELAYGNERLVGAFNWSNIGRSFDGVRADYKRGPANLSLFGARLGEAAPRPTRPHLYGAYGTMKTRPEHTVDAYVLYKKDRVSGASQNVTTIGTRSELKPKAGFDYTAEAAYQTGKNSGRDIRAWAYSVNAGYLLADPIKPRLAIEYNAASGGNPDDPNKYRTFDQLFPTNHDKYGIADYQGWRNMRNLRFSASAKPAIPYTVGADYHFFWLQNAQDAWYGAPGTPNRGVGGKILRDPTGAAGKNVGREFDLYGTYATSPDWNVSLGYARFSPGSFVRRVNGAADPSNWWYVQALWRK